MDLYILKTCLNKPLKILRFFFLIYSVNYLLLFKKKFDIFYYNCINDEKTQPNKIKKN